MLKYGGNFTTFQASVTGSAAVVTAVSNSAPRARTGIIVKALAANTQIVYLGNSASVTSSTGYPLAAGDSVTIPVDDPARIFAIAASGTQTLAIMYL